MKKMIEYLIPLGIGAGLAIVHSLYEDYQFRNFEKEIQKCQGLLEKLSKSENIDKIVNRVNNPKYQK
jgi:hypothetical protein